MMLKIAQSARGLPRAIQIQDSKDFAKLLLLLLFKTLQCTYVAIYHTYKTVQ